MKINKYCKNCIRHHVAGHPKNAAQHLKKYNDWCCYPYGKEAQKNIGACITHNWKITNEPTTTK